MRTLAAFMLALFAYVAPTYAQTLTITGTNITDVSGAPFTGKIGFTPVLSPSGPAISAQMGGGGQILPYARYFNVTSGTLQSGATLADTSTTSPVNLCYRVTYRYPGLPTNEADSGLINPCFQPSSVVAGSTNLSTMVQFLPPLTVVQTGPRGIPGQVAVGTVTELASGSQPTVVNVGTPDQAVFNFGIPAGTPGTTLGVQDASTFSGSDIGAKVNAAFAVMGGGGTVDIPAGNYSFSTMIVVPDSAGGTTGFHLDCSPGAVLTYTGSGNAIQITNDIPGSAEVGIDGHGGCLLVSASAGVGNGINIPPSNSTYVTGMKIKNFANGIFIPGGNSVQIFNNTIQSNTCGICTTTVNPTGSRGFAPNGLHIHDNEISANGWGYHSMNGQVSATHALGNDIRDNVFEGQTIGDIDADWDARLVITGNYFESAGVGIAVGPLNNVFSIHIEDNYFTASAGYRSEIELGFGFDFFILHNYEEGASVSSGCKVNSVPGSVGGNVNIVAVNAFAQNAEGFAPGTTPTPHELCLQGTPVSTLGGAERVEAGLHVTGPLTVDAPGFQLGPNSQDVGNTPVGFIGGVPVFIAGFDPAGTCATNTSAVNSGIWFTGDGIYICQGATATATTGVWTKK